jgi:hypothetical protein
MQTFGIFGGTKFSKLVRVLRYKHGQPDSQSLNRLRAYARPVSEKTTSGICSFRTTLRYRVRVVTGDGSMLATRDVNIFSVPQLIRPAND